MLTAKAQETDKIVGLEAGADDYFTKPFGIQELMARVRALLRRSGLGQVTSPVSPSIITHQALRIHTANRFVTTNDNRVELTPKEFDLLVLLAENLGKSYSRKELLDQVWDYHFVGYEHTVTAHINRLRNKIESDFTRPTYILTSWGVGYRFAEPEKPIGFMTSAGTNTIRIQSFPTTYGRLAALLSLLMILLVAGYSLLTGFIAIRYFKTSHQRLNRDVATHIAKFSQPFVGMNRVNHQATERIFFNAMVTNPSAEIYLLDTTGRVMVYQVPTGKIQRHQVDLAPIHQFIQTQGLKFIQGDDPRQTAGQQVFSAAQVRDKGQLQGYVYVVLLGESYGATLEQLLRDYSVKWGLKTTLFMLLAAFTVGFVVFYLLTRDLTRIIRTVIQFRDGNLMARTRLKPTSNLVPLANAFNTMADQLARSLAQLQTAEQLRRDLVANVSHDLRSPITSIRGYAETLDMDASLDSTQKHYVGAILQSTQRLTKRINELFELSKLEASERKPEKEPFLLADLLTDTYLIFD